MKQLTILVGPPGSGKSTLSQNLLTEYNNKPENHPFNIEYINQDTQGKEHLTRFNRSIEIGIDIIVDRMNFNKQQREKYIKAAKSKGYKTRIIVLHESYDTCFRRCMERKDHPTIKCEQDARSALDTFFTRYERPTLDEADEVEFRYPEVDPLSRQAVIVDIDGTLSDTSHRQHFVQKPKGEKKDWKSFFDNMHLDPINTWCRLIANRLRSTHQVCIVSGRSDSYKDVTTEWLDRHNVFRDHLFMRPRSDSRDDTIIKEIILDFELLTRYSILMAIDDRKRIVDMWRRRGIVTLHCAEGDF